ncbi:MAG: S1 RNA-binding domain-containing protein, partial [Anaerorhabdus sp.]
IEDDGRCVIYHFDREMLNKAQAMIENIIRDAKVGEIYEGKVTRIEKFGAFVELFPGTDGLLHVSKISYDRVEKPEDVLKLGDIVKVVVTEIDDKGRVNVSARDLLEKPEGWDEAQKAKKEAFEKRRNSEGGERRVFKKKD